MNKKYLQKEVLQVKSAMCNLSIKLICFKTNNKKVMQIVNRELTVNVKLLARKSKISHLENV